jgi:hypothetical protein
MKTRILAVLLSALFSVSAYAAATDAAKGNKPGASRIKKIQTQYSPLTGNIATTAVNPALITPDLVPYVGSFLSSCSWDESKGETCESKCPPIEITLGLGTKNISQRPLAGPVAVKLLAHPAGTVAKSWNVTDVAGQAVKAPGWLKKTLVRCHPPGQASVSQPPPPNYRLAIDTAANETDKNNNTRLLYIGPDTRIGP